MEEARQHLGDVLARGDPRDLDDARQAQAAVPQGRGHLGEPLDQLRRGLAVEGRAGGELQFTVQEVEETRVAQLLPTPLRVEGREGEQEFGHRPALAAKEGSEAGGEVAGGVHGATLSRKITPSVNARIPRLDRFPRRGLLPPHAGRGRGAGCGWRSLERFAGGAWRRKFDPTSRASSITSREAHEGRAESAAIRSVARERRPSHSRRRGTGDPTRPSRRSRS